MVVTDGFTGNVALKSLEGRAPVARWPRVRVFESSPEAKAGRGGDRRCCSTPRRLYDPEVTGGGVLLGVEGRVRDLARLVVGERDRRARSASRPTPSLPTWPERIREAVANAG